ncbi:MAG: decaprenyl-phosphate phosphoribosyltransferase [Pyrinomonadaceae bacterium]
MKVLEIEQPASFVIGRILRGLVIEMRPQEWSKNLLVFSGVIFSRSLTDINNLWISILGFAVFCAASSGIYIFNDLCDLREDKQHPIKRYRPLASGKLSVPIARLAMTLLFAIAALGSLALSYRFALIIALYLAICIGYSLRLKDIVILDVILIASGFVLRAVSGAFLIGVAPSEWLVLCTSMVALLIGFGKRRHEIVLLDQNAENHRRSLSDYSVDFLDSIMNICAAAAVITYALYTRADETVARVGSSAMLVTIPFVIYGVFRYLFLVQKGTEGGNPIRILYFDRPTRRNLLLWVLVVILVLYLPALIRTK